MDGEIQAYARTVPGNVEDPSLRLEGDGFPRRLHGLENDRSRSHSAMSAKIQLDRRGEPAKLIVLIGLNEEGGYRKTVLPGDEPQGLVIEPTLQRADHGWIPREDGSGESVDVVGGDLQGFNSQDGLHLTTNQ